MTQMKILRYLTFLLVSLIPLAGYCDDVTFDVRAPKTVRVGDRFNLSYVLNADGSDMRLGDTEDFDVLMGPSQSTSRSIQIINGDMKQSYQSTFTFILKAKKEGTFTIPAARITSGGKQISSAPVTINVVAADASVPQNNQQQSSGGSQTSQSQSKQSSDIVIVQSLNRTSVYEGEPVVLTTKIYTRAHLQQISDIKQPDLTQFVTSDLRGGGQLQFSQEQYDGKYWDAAVADIQMLIPQKSGKLTINPTEYEFVVKQRSSRGGGGFFDSFFDDVQLVKRLVRSNAVSVDVKPLPQSTTKTSGGVGDFNFSVSVSPTDVTVDNSVQVKVSVTGEGNLKLLTLPKPQLHSDFDTFDPSENVNIDVTSHGYKGTKSAEYLIIPRRDGDFEIPAMSFVYFNPQQGKYVTKTQGPFTIHVSKGDGTQTSNTPVFSGNSREQVQYLGKDLRYIHTDNSLVKRDEFFLFSPLFFLCIFIPLAAFIAVFVIYRKRISDSMNISGVKRRRANKAARKRLKMAARYMKEQKREAFFDEVMRALWGYLSDKLTLPLSVLTKDNAKEEMEKHNIDSSAADDFMQLLDACEFARYAPVEMAEPMEKIYGQAEDVIEKIDGYIK